jgi:hypothetical protein
MSDTSPQKALGSILQTLSQSVKGCFGPNGKVDLILIFSGKEVVIKKPPSIILVLGSGAEIIKHLIPQFKHPLANFLLKSL